MRQFIRVENNNNVENEVENKGNTLVPYSGTPRADSHLTLEFVVPCPLSLASHQTKDIFGQTQAG